MIDPKLELLSQGANVTVDIVGGNYVGALEQARKLTAMLEAFIVPPINPTSLDPNDRAAVDAEVDAEATKT